MNTKTVLRDGLAHWAYAHAYYAIHEDGDKRRYQIFTRCGIDLGTSEEVSTCEQPVNCLGCISRGKVFKGFSLKKPWDGRGPDD